MLSLEFCASTARHLRAIYAIGITPADVRALVEKHQILMVWSDAPSSMAKFALVDFAGFLEFDRGGKFAVDSLAWSALMPGNDGFIPPWLFDDWVCSTCNTLNLDIHKTCGTCMSKR